MQPTGVLETAKATNPLKDLLKFGQSVWLDYIRRDLLTSGELKRLIDEDGLRGMTSNPTIFEKAITGSTTIRRSAELAAAAHRPRRQGPLRNSRHPRHSGCRRLSASGVRQHRSGATATSAWKSRLISPATPRARSKKRAGCGKQCGRENVMIKVPGTAEGIPAFQQLISEGINVNITLLFAQEVYEKVAEAYIAGLEQFAANGGDVSTIASVASFFISRIDTAVDAIIDAKLKSAKDAGEQEQLKSIQGKVAIANGKLTYREVSRHFQHALAGKPWPPRERRRSACSGPAPAPRILRTATCFTSRN